MSQTANGKSPNMEKMERLSEAVYKSWIRDMDKVEEMKEVHEFLTEILSKDTIEDYFQSSNDFNFFILIGANCRILTCPSSYVKTFFMYLFISG